MMKMKYKFLIFLFTISVAFAAFPKPVGYVNDFAGILADTETLEQDIVAGPYHPSFGELVKGKQALKEELYYEKTFYHNAV